MHVTSLRSKLLNDAITDIADAISNDAVAKITHERDLQRRHRQHIPDLRRLRRHRHHRRRLPPTAIIPTDSH